MTQTSHAEQTVEHSTQSNRVHWYDGADLSDTALLKEILVLWNTSWESGSLDPKVIQTMSPDDFRQSRDFADPMRTYFLSFCRDFPNNNTRHVIHLLEKGMVNPDFWLDDNGKTPLMAAHTFAAVEKLLKHGANPNAQDCQGKTPLMIHAMRYQPDSAYVEQSLSSFLLLLHRPETDLKIRDKEGQGILDYVSGKPLLETLVQSEREKRAAIRAFSLSAHFICSIGGGIHSEVVDVLRDVYGSDDAPMKLLHSDQGCDFSF